MKRARTRGRDARRGDSTAAKSLRTSPADKVRTLLFALLRRCSGSKPARDDRATISCYTYPEQQSNGANRVRNTLNRDKNKSEDNTA